MRDVIKETLTDALLSGTAAFLLLVLIAMARYGEYALYEHNKVILITEIVLCVGMFILGIARLVSFIKARCKGWPEKKSQ